MVAYQKPVEVEAYMCPKCKQTVYARCIHDTHTCFCGSVICQGKLSETAGKNNVFSFDKSDIIVDASINQLMLDFYYNGGHYGTIQGEKK